MEYFIELLFYFSLFLILVVAILYLVLSIIYRVLSVNYLLSLSDDLEEIVIDHRKLKEEREIRDKFIEYRDKYEALRSPKIRNKKDD